MRTKFFFLVISFFSLPVAYSQMSEIRAIVKDSASKEAIPFCSASVYKNGLFVVRKSTDVDGNFSVSIDPGTYRMEINSIGYSRFVIETLVLKPGEVKTINVSLVQSNIMLSEVVVTTTKPLIRKEKTSMSTTTFSSGVFGRSRKGKVTRGDEESFGFSSGEGMGEAGKLTCGEISDFTKWSQWERLEKTGFAEFLRKWKFSIGERYTVQVMNLQKNAVPFAKVSLFSGDSLVWSAVTDNTGKAELWGAHYSDRQKLKIKVEADEKTEWIDRVFPFGEMINFVSMDVPCTAEPVPLEIAMVVDATSSMSDEINYLKQDLADVINKTKEFIRSPIRMGTLFYRDNGDEYVMRKSEFNPDLSVTTKFINSQSAGGGGDLPEALDVALQEAVLSLGWSGKPSFKIMFVVLDATHHNNEQAIDNFSKAVRMAAEKGIRIVPVVCSGANKDLEFLMRSVELATNGAYIFLTDDSGIGGSHMKPSTDKYDKHTLNQLLVNIIRRFSAQPECEKITSEVPMNEAEVKYLLREDDREDNEEDYSTPSKKDKAPKMDWRVFPNPCVDETTVEFTKGVTGNLQLFDMSGKLLRDFSLSDQQRLALNVSDLARGNYFVVFRNDKITDVKKIIKS